MPADSKLYEFSLRVCHAGSKFLGTLMNSKELDRLEKQATQIVNRLGIQGIHTRPLYMESLSQAKNAPNQEPNTLLQYANSRALSN